MFSNLPAPFDGLGFKASWNHTDTDFETQDPIYGDQILDDGTFFWTENRQVEALD